MFNNILVVCVGNICRSPVGERLLRQLLPEKNITSAGVGAMVGCPVDSLAADVAKEHGLETSKHFAKQLTPEMCHQADLILAMSEKIRQEIYSQVPEARGKVMLFGKWLDELDIPDPFKQKRTVHEKTYELLDKAAQTWVDVVRIQI
jgi:protein-tyrosine phosphatase